MSPYRNPGEQLVAELSRLRDQGYPFPAALKRAKRAVKMPHNRESRNDWRVALDAEAVRDELRAAYEGEPTPISATFSALPLDAPEHPRPVARTASIHAIKSRPGKPTQERRAFVA